MEGASRRVLGVGRQADWGGWGLGIHKGVGGASGFHRSNGRAKRICGSNKGQMQSMEGCGVGGICRRDVGAGGIRG